MEKIEYGPVTLDVIATEKFHRSSVRDEVNNHMMSKWEVEAICNFHPAPNMVSYVRAAGAEPTRAAGRLPGETDLAILNTLLKPRQLLKITAGGSVVLETPRQDPGKQRYTLDAKNGPTCEFVSVPKQIGSRHWIVHVRFVAHTSDCTGTDSIVLSNVWASILDVDELWYPTRSVAGKAVLRTDMMRQRHVTADDFRQDFFFPLDPYYVRENINVKLSEDGATLYWSFVDVGRCYNTGAGITSPIRKIEIYRTTYSKAGSGGLASRQAAYENEMDVLENLTPSTAAEVARRSAMRTFRTANNNMPQHNLNIRCDIWGDRNARNSDITKLALGVCLNQGIASGVPFGITQSELMCRQELTNRFVSAEITYKWADQFSVASPLLGLPAVVLPGSAQGPNARGGVIILNSNFLDYTDINARRIEAGNQQYNVLTQAGVPNPSPPRSGTASTLVESMIVQALLAPCVAVPRPATLENHS